MPGSCLKLSPNDRSHAMPCTIVKKLRGSLSGQGRSRTPKLGAHRIWCRLLVSLAEEEVA